LNGGDGDMIVLGGCETGNGKSKITFLGTRLAADSMLLLDCSESLDSAAESLDCSESLSSSEGGLLSETFLLYFFPCFFSRLYLRTAAGFT
jgi:hypothetical protein